MKIPFDIKYKPKIESGEYKVCDQAGNSARIICWDAVNKAKPDQCIIALVKEDPNSNNENSKWYDTKGFGARQCNCLFIIIPEPEPTELERAIKRGMLCAGAEDVSATIIKETAKEVKGIICKGCTVGLNQYWKGREDAMKDYDKPITYHYPTYPSSCIHGGVCTSSLRDCTICPRTGGTTTSGTCKKD